MYKATEKHNVRDALDKLFPPDGFGYKDIQYPQLILSSATPRELW